MKTQNLTQDVYAELVSRYPWHDASLDTESVDYWNNPANWEVSKHNFIFNFTIEDIESAFEFNPADKLYFITIAESEHTTYVADFGATMDSEANYSLVPIDLDSYVNRTSSRLGTGKRAPRQTGLTLELWLKCFLYSRANCGENSALTKKVYRLMRQDNGVYVIELCQVQFDRPTRPELTPM